LSGSGDPAPAAPDARPDRGATHPRRIRSYVLREGRITRAQQRAYDELGPRWSVAWAPEPLDLDALYGRRAPRFVEIGFGMGEATAAIAAAHPQHDYLAIEVHSPGVGSLLAKIDALGLGNVRIVQHDAVEVLREMIAPDTLAGVHLFFPDPWPKKRHHKRRLLQPAFATLVAGRIAPGGYFHAATDWEDYARHMLEVLSAEPLLANTAAGYAPRPAYRPPTRFEQRGQRLGHPVWDLVFRRRES
jgi:tRNA (guanine-N7-)-methyltransferase